MSAVHRPNKNFDNETMIHTPYSEIVRGQLKSSYEKFREAKTLPDKKKKKKKALPEPVRTTMNKWFGNGK